MKRLVLVASGMLMLVALSSCERNYTCTCVYPDKAAGTNRTTIRAYNRTDARNTCASINEGAKLHGGACAL